MTGLRWRVTELLANSLAPAEREAVLGDLAESQSTFVASVSDIAGLALRRAAAACSEPRTAIAFFVLVVPLSLLLTDMARRTAPSLAIAVWFWTSNLDLHLVRNAGFWRLVAENAPHLLFACGMLALYGWSAGMLAACVSRTTSRLLCLTLLLTAMTWPLFSDGRYGAQNDAVFHLAFYRIFFPCLVQCIFVLLPALFALHQRRTETAS